MLKVYKKRWNRRLREIVEDVPCRRPDATKRFVRISAKSSESEGRVVTEKEAEEDGGTTMISGRHACPRPLVRESDAYIETGAKEARAELGPPPACRLKVAGSWTA